MLSFPWLPSLGAASGRDSMQLSPSEFLASSVCCESWSMLQPGVTSQLPTTA